MRKEKYGEKRWKKVNPFYETVSPLKNITRFNKKKKVKKVFTRLPSTAYPVYEIWAVKVCRHVVQALCWMLHPLCGLLQPLCGMSLTKTGNEDIEPRRGTKIGNKAKNND